MARTFYREQNKFLKATGKSSVLRLKSQLEKLDKVASGGTYNSVDYNIVNTPRQNSSKLFVTADKAIININDGRAPGKKQPPKDVIIDWIDSLDFFFYNENGSIMPIEQQAFLIGRAIGRDGIEPTNIIDLVFGKKSFKDLLERRLKKASLQDIQTRMTTLLKEI